MTEETKKEKKTGKSKPHPFKGKFPHKNSPDFKPMGNLGRPREWDRTEIAIKMLEWAKDERNINLCGFSADNLIPSPKILEWARTDEDFRQTYELVRDFIGRRREERLTKGELHVKAYDLNAMTYDAHLRAEIRGQLEFDYKLKSRAEIDVNESTVKQFDALNQQLLFLQRSQQDKPSDDIVE